MSELIRRSTSSTVPVSEVTIPSLRDIVEVLAAADPEDKSELYAQLGVSLSYDPTGTVTVQAHPRGVTVGVGGGT